MRKAFIMAYLLSPGNVAIGTSPKFYQQNVLKIPEMIVASHYYGDIIQHTTNS